jgi:hypothetical protein
MEESVKNIWVAIMEPNPATSDNEKKDKKPCHNKKEIT